MSTPTKRGLAAGTQIWLEATSPDPKPAKPKASYTRTVLSGKRTSTVSVAWSRVGQRLRKVSPRT